MSMMCVVELLLSFYFHATSKVSSLAALGNCVVLASLSILSCQCQPDVIIFQPHYFLCLFFFSPVFDFTSQYLVRVDDFFLHYMQKVHMDKKCNVFELHKMTI